MSAPVKKIFIWLGVAAGIAAVILLRLTTANGAFSRTEPQRLGNCASVALPGSAADLEVDRTSGIAYLSVLDRRAVGNDALLGGTILKLDLNQPQTAPVPAITGAPQGFRPAGLSLWVHPEGPARLFVVNRPLNADGAELETVEIFELDTDGLFHYRKTVIDPLFLHPNDVAAVGPDQFYLTNDRGTRNFLTRAFELVIQPGWSDVVYYDGAHASVAASGRVFATGVTVSADGLRVYLSEAGARQLLIFDRDTENGSLYWSSLIEVPGAPDKLDIGEDGSLWATVQPDTWALNQSLHSADTAPTMVLKFNAPVNGFTKAQTVYASDGREFSGGSVAIAHGDRVILGSVTEKRLLTCLAPK